MSRVDVPTLRCDRCGHETQDLGEMGRFSKLGHYHMTGKDEWDLCPSCWAVFSGWVSGGDQPQDDPFTPETCPQPSWHTDHPTCPACTWRGPAASGGDQHRKVSHFGDDTCSCGFDGWPCGRSGGDQ